MVTAPEHAIGPRDPRDTNALLQRILASIEKDGRRGRLELVIAVVLSLATLASTWCAYQARQWGAAQGSNQTAADTAERKGAEQTIVALQVRTQDGLVLLEYWRAIREGDAKTSEAVLAHMRPVLRAALDASIKAGVLTNPEVPGPLQRKEYVLEEEQEARAQRDRAGGARSEAVTAGKNAGDHVVLTLMFASVLFFGGIGGTFREWRVRAGLAGVAIVLFAITVTMLATLPPYKA